MRVAKMYKSFFKLQSSPFGTSPDPRFLYMMPHTREALACLEYGISARKGFTVLTGRSRDGKDDSVAQGIEFVQQSPCFDGVRLQSAA